MIYTYEQILEILKLVGGAIIDCTKDEFPHLTLHRDSEAEDEPIGRFSVIGENQYIFHWELTN